MSTFETSMIGLAAPSTTQRRMLLVLLHGATSGSRQ